MAKSVNWTAPSRSSRRRRAGLDPDAVAALAFDFLLEQPERLQCFMALTGFDAAGLRQVAEEPAFGQAVLSYLCEDEVLLVAFAADIEQPPERIAAITRGRAEREAWSGG